MANGRWLAYSSVRQKTGLYLGRFSFDVKPSSANHLYRISSLSNVNAKGATSLCRSLFGAMRTRALVVLMVSVLVFSGTTLGSAGLGDFNSDGVVDFVDLALFIESFGATDLRFDLDGNGRVDFEDMFLLADRFGVGMAQERARTDSVFAARLNSALQQVQSTVRDTIEGSSNQPSSEQNDTAVRNSEAADQEDAFMDTIAETVPEGGSLEKSAAYYRIESSGQQTRLRLPNYSVTVQSGSPFGIVSLKLSRQAVDFAHFELPLGDWEWFWYRRAGTTDQWMATKLLQPDWGNPNIVEEPERILVRFQRRNVTEPGVDLEVTYRFPIDGACFGIEYAVTNGTLDELDQPYLMVGFPGFSNQGFVSEVADAVARRPVTPPYASFQQEAARQAAPEIVLLRQDVDPGRSGGRTLEGSVKLRLGATSYRLTTRFTADSRFFWVYSAHTNKPLYLTSHLYIFLQTLRPTDRCVVNVEYELTQD